MLTDDELRRVLKGVLACHPKLARVAAGQEELVDARVLKAFAFDLSSAAHVAGEEAERRRHPSASGPRPSGVVAAQEFLRTYLATGPRLGRDVIAAAATEGHAQRTVERAKWPAGIVSDGRGKWGRPEHFAKFAK